MLQKITADQLVQLFRREYPNWAETAWSTYALQLKNNLDERLEDAIVSYAADGTEVDFYQGEFTVMEIRRLRRCGYLEALMLMDEYLKNPVKGRMRIMRR